MKRLLKKLLAVTGAAALAAGIGITGLMTAPAAEAADASQFNPGMLITDSLFYDSDAMTAAEIQTFLNQKGKYCESNCLKDHKVTTTSQPATSRCDGYTGRSNETAAQVIANVAESCGISPMTILVMLEKETSLVTMTDPGSWRYERAMGYYCPDDPNRPGWCHPEYAGLFNQIYNASAQLQRYHQNPRSYGYKAGQTNNILYNPDASCGTKSVYIENQATASLYIYTPYTPNKAALNNLYGTGDSCSAYGNRNFWRLYTDWFGPTTAQAPASKPASGTKPVATPKPTATPKPAVTPKPTATPTATPKPTETQKPAVTPKPTATQKPTETQQPAETPTVTPKPTATKTPTPSETSKPTAKPIAPIEGEALPIPTGKPDGTTAVDAEASDGPKNSAAPSVPEGDDPEQADNDKTAASPEAESGGSVADSSSESAATESDTVAESADNDVPVSPLTVIPPSDKTDDSVSAEADADAEDGAGSTLTVVPTVSTESTADEDVLAQTGAAQVLVMLGIVVSLGVLGATMLMARRRTA